MGFGQEAASVRWELVQAWSKTQDQAELLRMMDTRIGVHIPRYKKARYATAAFSSQVFSFFRTLLALEFVKTEPGDT